MIMANWLPRGWQVKVLTFRDLLATSRERSVEASLEPGVVRVSMCVDPVPFDHERSLRDRLSCFRGESLWWVTVVAYGTRLGIVTEHGLMHTANDVLTGQAT